MTHAPTVAVVVMLLAPPAFAQAFAEAYDLPFTKDRTAVRLSSDTEPHLDAYADVVGAVLARAGAWLPPEREDGPAWPAVRFLYLCEDDAKLTAVERHHGYENAYGAKPSPFPDWGRHYDLLGVISVRRRPGHDHRQVIAHEVAHAVSRPSIGRPGVFLDEGLAEVLANWVLFSEGVSPADEPVIDLVRTTRAAELIRRRRTPSLQTLLTLSFADFHGRRERDHYDLAWSFVRTLAEQPTDPDDEDGQSLLERVLSAARERASIPDRAYGRRGAGGASRPPRLDDAELIARETSLRTLEAAWRRSLADDAATGWRPISSEWYLTGERVIGVATTGGAGVLLHEPRTRAISTRLERPLSPQLSAGIVAAHRGPDDYVIISVTGDGDQLEVHERVGGDWAATTHRALPTGFDPTLSRFSVFMRDASFVVRIDGAPFMKHALSLGAARGTMGLFMQRRYDAAGGWSDGQVTFVDVETN